MKKNSAQEMAVQQLIGFAHARAGYDIKDLAESMGLTRGEWVAIKGQVELRPDDEAVLDEMFA